MRTRTLRLLRHHRGMDYPQIPEADKAAFLDTLRDTCTIAKAVRAIGISRRQAYDLRSADPEFASGWENALDEGVDGLEFEAQRRAFEGTDDPVYQGGALVGHIRKYSDTLAMFLLKAHRPERFRERTEVKHTGEVDITQRILAARKAHGA